MIALACDHTGIELKKEIMKLLDSMNLTYKDFGTNEAVSCDYPIYGYRAAKAVASGECDRGILICGTGIGIGIAAMKCPGIYAARCDDAVTARLARQQLDVNMLTFGQRVTGFGVALEMVYEFLRTPFDEANRENVRRIKAAEKQFLKEAE